VAKPAHAVPQLQSKQLHKRSLATPPVCLLTTLGAHGQAHPDMRLASDDNPPVFLAAARHAVAAAGFLLYSIVGLALIIYLIFWVAPEHGTENVLVYLAICSLAGSFTVTSCKVGTCWAVLRCAVWRCCMFCVAHLAQHNHGCIRR
jgi:hypothetical protein